MEDLCGTAYMAANNIHIHFAGGTHSRNDRAYTALHCKLAMDRPASVEQGASVEGSTGSTRKRRNRAKFSFPDVCF